MADLLAASSYEGTRQWLEAALKVYDEQQVREILAKHRTIFAPCYGATALHHAVFHDHDLIAAQLLIDRPELIDKLDDFNWDALRYAAAHGKEKVLKVLLANRPSSHFVASGTETALFLAAGAGRENIVAELLAANPASAKTVDPENNNWTALHHAAMNGEAGVVNLLLASDPGLIHAVATDGATVLHMFCGSTSRDKQLLVKLLAANPAALRALDAKSEIPFVNAVASDNDCAIELMQWQLTFDEVVNAFVSSKKPYEQRLRPILEGQCEGLVGWMNQDVVGVVFEYLGVSNTHNLPAPQNSGEKNTR